MADLQLHESFTAAPEVVFAAWTEPARLERWIWGSVGRDCRASVDLRVGGAFRVGTRRPDGSEWALMGEFVEITPGRGLVCSLKWDAPMGYESPGETLAVGLSPRPDGTDMTFRHGGVPTQAARDEHERGWRDVFRMLAIELSRPE